MGGHLQCIGMDTSLSSMSISLVFCGVFALCELILVSVLLWLKFLSLGLFKFKSVQKLFSAACCQFACDDKTSSIPAILTHDSLSVGLNSNGFGEAE